MLFKYGEDWTKNVVFRCKILYKVYSTKHGNSLQKSPEKKMFLDTINCNGTYPIT